ncbi:MAG: hypothetical protein AB9903_34850 [Vulcanimicrobiota bacterium]
MSAITENRTSVPNPYISSQYFRTSGRDSLQQSSTLPPQPYEKYQQSEDSEDMEEELESFTSNVMQIISEMFQPSEESENPQIDSTSSQIDSTSQQTDGTEGTAGQSSEPPSALQQVMNQKINFNFPNMDQMGPYEDMAKSLCSSYDEQGRQIPLTKKQEKRMAMMMSSYDISTLQNLQKEGVKIDLVDDGFFPEGSGGGYRADNKHLALRSSSFSDDAPDGRFLSGVSSGRHELGHAIDDMLAPDMGNIPIYQSDNNEEVNEMFTNYQNRVAVDSSQRWDGYKWDKLNPGEYVGEGMELYQFAKETRDLLKEKDPALYAYIENMLQQAATENRQ